MGSLANTGYTVVSFQVGYPEGPYLENALSSRIATSAWCWLWRFAFLLNSDLSDSDSVDYLDLHSLSLLIAKVEICLPSPKISQIKLYFVRAAIHSPSWNMTLAAVQVSIFNRIKAKGCSEGVFPYLWRQSR